MKIELVDYKEMNKGVLRGFFTLCIDSIQITDCSYFQQGDNRWFSFPSKKIEPKDGGKAKYYPYIRISDKAKYEDLQDKVLAMLKAKGLGESTATKTVHDDTSAIPF
jgi:hypothetical protein